MNYKFSSLWRKLYDYVGITSTKLNDSVVDDHNIDDGNYKKLNVVELNQMEHFLAKKNLPSIGTITLFSGNFDVACEFLLQRFITVVKANPWLCGETLLLPNNRLVLQYPSCPTDVEIRRLFCSNTEPFDFRSNETLISYEDFVKIKHSFMHHLVPAGVSNKMQRNKRLVQLSIIQNKNENEESRSPSSCSAVSEFAVIFSLSHIVGDGYTYYRLLNMIFGCEDVVSLNIKREAEELVPKSFKSKLAPPIPMILLLLSKYLICWLLGKTAMNTQLCFISDDFVTQVKNRSMQKERQWVSTNDTICAEICRVIDAKLLRMIVNVRGRLFDKANIAENCLSMAVFPLFEFMHCPAMLRRKMTQDPIHWMGLGAISIPYLIYCLNKNAFFVTNWSTFSKVPQIEGCTEYAHLPFINNESTLSQGYGMHFGVIFRYKHNMKGIMIRSSNWQSMQKLKNSDLFL